MFKALDEKYIFYEQNVVRRDNRNIDKPTLHVC